MNARTIKALGGAVIAAAAVILCAAPVLADGIMIPVPRPHLPRPAPFGIKYHRVDVSIDNQIATTTIDQVFLNENDVDLEGSYVFPIPESASITDFAMWMNGEKIPAELLDADEARRVYEEIVRKSRDPALLEYAGRDIFRARVFPIPRRGEARIEIKYQELLKMDGGLVGYRYPLNTEKFSPTNLQEARVAVEIESNVPIKAVYSPSHEVDVRQGTHHATCSWEETQVKPDRDFLLYYTVSEDEVGFNLLTSKDRARDGYFALLISPGALPDDEEPMPKDVVFVIDTSGSMKGEKIDQAKEALSFCLRGLNREDRFNIIGFATAVNTFAETLLPADRDNVDRALRFVERMSARGGTAISDALRAALDRERSERPGMVIFLTDGEPTIGETDPDRILAEAARRNDARLRIFAFGVGHDVNTRLLDQLAADNRGAVDYVGPREKIEARVSGFFEKVSRPVLADLRLDFGGMDVEDLYPSDLPDLFAGGQLVLLGRYRRGGEATLRLRGSTGRRTAEFTYRGRFSDAEDEHDFIPRLWASRKIGYLMNEIRLHGRNKELVDEVVALSKEYGIITPYTSYLILEEGTVADRQLITPGLQAAARRPNAPRAFHELAAPLESRWGGAATPPDLSGTSMAKGMKDQVGAEAFDASSGLVRLRQSSVTPENEMPEVKYVGGRSFYKTADGWTDALYKEGSKVTEVPFLSDRYFELLRLHPEIGKFLSLGEGTVFLFGNQTYRVVG